MADIVTNLSSYASGTNDTASTLVNNVSATDAIQPNGIASAAVQIEATLGVATTLKGSQADLVARLAVAINADGTIKLGTDAALSGILSELHGGTGLTAVPNACYKGPLSVGSGSTRTHEGAVTISGNTNLSGVHYYTDFTLNNAITLTVPAGTKSLVIIATGTITINGTIAAQASGGTGGAGGAPTVAGTPGHHGTDQPGSDGGNGGTSSENGPAPKGTGGDLLVNGCIVALHGAPAIQATASDVIRLSELSRSAMGGSGGGGGGGGATAASENPGGSGGTGGNGGASICLIAPTVILASTATLNTSGSNGANGGVGTFVAPGGGGGGGGGSAGNIYIICRTYTNNGATFTQTGGSAGTGGAVNGGSGVAGIAGSAGVAGIRQIDIYG